PQGPTGRELTAARERGRLTRAQLARALEVSERSVQLWERGDLPVPPTLVAELELALEQAAAEPPADPVGDEVRAILAFVEERGSATRAIIHAQRGHRAIVEEAIDRALHAGDLRVIRAGANRARQLLYPGSVLVPDEELEQIGRTLREARLAAAMTLAGAGELLGVSASQVSQWET